MHRGLGDPVHVDQPRRHRIPVQPRGEALRFQCLPAEHHELKGQLTIRPGAVDRGQRIKRCRRLAQHTHALIDEQAVELLGRTCHRFGHHHQPAAMQQRTENLPHRKVKSQRMTLRPHLARRQRHIAIDRSQQPRHIPMRDRHTLGNTRRTRGVDQIRDVARRRPHRQRRTRLAVDRAVVDIDHRQPTPTQPIHEISGRYRDRRLGVGQYEIQPCVGHRGIDRHIGRTGLQHPHDRHNSLNRPWEQQRHPMPGTHALLDEQVRQPIRSGIQSAVRHRTVTEADRDRRRMTSHLRVEQHRDRHRHRRHPTQCDPITPPVELLDVSADSDRGKRPPRSGGHRGQNPLEAIRQITGVATDEQLAHARRAEKKLLVLLEEDQTELIDQTGVRDGSRCGSTGEFIRGNGRNEIDRRPGRRLSAALES